METEVAENSEKKVKKCSTCGLPKELKDFSKRGSSFRSQCRVCRQAKKRKWKQEHPEVIRAENKEWRQKNKEYIREYRKNNPEILKAIRKRDYENHKKERRQQAKEWNDKNKDRLQELKRISEKKWRENNREKYLASSRRSSEKRRLRPEVRLHQRTTTAIYHALRGNKQGRKWETLVGYTLVRLYKHLEKLFLPGMSWENMGEWHIDHQIPVSAFNFERPDDAGFKKCWALKPRPTASAAAPWPLSSGA